ncbi:hypothetical protein G7046_g8225 [Stylonectria norvegica]|nr:hypothetical protein G7046_g8225 [Stylonectria norvegica]
MAAHHHLSSDSAIFSPSVARIAASTARDWSYVDSWLTSKFLARSVPVFERNPETLQALLRLATFNEAADEERHLLARTEAAALQEHDAYAAAQKTTTPGPGGQALTLSTNLLDAVAQNLPAEGQIVLDAMALMSLPLGLAFPEPEVLAFHMVQLQSSVYETEQTRARIEVLQRHVDDEAVNMHHFLCQLQADAYKPAPDLAKQNLEMQRRIKAMSAKLPELQDRVAALAAGLDSSHPTINDVARYEAEYLDILARKKELHLQMISFQRLPSNPDMARSELESLRSQLRNITSRRDAVFEGLVERESPVKRR